MLIPSQFQDVRADISLIVDQDAGSACGIYSHDLFLKQGKKNSELCAYNKKTIAASVHACVCTKNSNIEYLKN